MENAIVAGTNQFAFQVYRQLSQQSSENLIFSPYSLCEALTMTMAGADGETRAELIRALDFPTQQQAIDDGLLQIRNSLASNNPHTGVQLEIANRLFGQEGFGFRSEFLQRTRDTFQAELAQVDFRKPEAARGAINQWVSQQTAGQIPELLSPGALPQDSRLVLANAIYFLGKWSKPFVSDWTAQADFFLTSDETISVSMMTQSERFRYAEDEHVQLLELPYGDGQFSLVVCLPREFDGIRALEERFSFVYLQGLLESLRENQVEVFLPKFQQRSQSDIQKTLVSLGVTSLFDPSRADLSRMTANGDLFISAVVHEARIEVDEEGTEAAAATAVVAAPTAAPVEQPSKPRIVRVDHPCVYLIRHNTTGCILFLGRLAKPE